MSCKIYILIRIFLVFLTSSRTIKFAVTPVFSILRYFGIRLNIDRTPWYIVVGFNCCTFAVRYTFVLEWEHTFLTSDFGVDTRSLFFLFLCLARS